MNRADDRGSQATTRVRTAPRVTLNWQATPFTLRGKEGSPKWIRESNGRKVLVTSTGKGKPKYWRAPRPRLRTFRRSRRREKKKVMQAALSKSAAIPTILHEAQVAIAVLQQALRAALQREDALKEKLQKTVKQSNKLIPEQLGDSELQFSEKAESGFRGVTRNKAGWAAHTARSDGHRQHLGTFNMPIQAARARRNYYADVVAVVQQTQQWIPNPRVYCAGAVAAIQQAPRWIPNPTFCIFWSIVLFVIANTGVPWYLIPIGLILIYGLLLSMVDV